MKNAMILALIAAVALVGCKKSQEGGGVGKDTFTIHVPAMTTDVKQGELQTVRVSIDRGDAFKQAVKLEFKSSKGIDVDPGSTTVKPGDKGDVQLKISAAKDAPIGQSTVTVTGTPDKGDATRTEFSVSVSAK